MKIRKGDTVRVITGKDRGKTGKVKEIFRKNQRIVVEGINVLKKHRKSQGQDKPGGIIDFEGPIHISNVMVIDQKSGKPSRVGFRVEKGKKERIAKVSNSKL